ncbi:MAG TPA: cell division protein ZipA C-terminal FtsZ-binding domain-containing protein [Burkholderiaceae bacterium]|jgi:FtsZ-interacting cell division protein ZipA|nr:cell division protein ZipA C-terminal FtsZ-binding domain-containing protein [Burkholderiaceae bacterium]
MTDLEQSLIAIGGTIVVGVFVYNKWQEHKAKKSVERAFSSTHDDVLMTPGDAPPKTKGGRKEPSFSGDEQQDDDRHAAPDTQYDEQYNEHDQDSQADDAKRYEAEDFSAAPSQELPIDDMIDCAISVALAARVRGDKIILASQTMRHVGNKPVHVIGLREDQVWEAIAHGGVYVALHVGVQLANRSSMLNELEYSELVGRLRQFCDELDAEPDLPDMTEVMKSARALHQFVGQFDAKLSVNIQSTGAPWAISTLLQALERQGFDVRPDGRLVMPDGDGGILFSLSTNVTLAEDTSSRLTLLLDVPCVAPERDGYGAMISFAKVLASRLGGNVVDDSNQPLSDDALREIAGQVNDFCRDMEATGVAAGSLRALRLFN